MPALLLLMGCQNTIIEISEPNTVHLSGRVLSGDKPIVDSEVALYVTGGGGGGTGSSSTLLIPKTFKTDTSGGFLIEGTETCPDVNAETYLVASGGHPVSNSAPANTSIKLMTALGSCGNLNSRTTVTVNEVTTVGSLWPFAPYTTSVTTIGGSAAELSSLASANSTTDKLVDITSGTAPGPLLSADEIAPTAKLQAMASIIAACVDSSGGAPGDGTPCGSFFSAADSGHSLVPADTLTAALQIAKNPFNNVLGIFDLYQPPTTFLSVLSSAPSDWTLPILTRPAPPSISPAGGSVTDGQRVTIADASPGVTIYYTMDGSVPTASSNVYSEPFPISASLTISAVAVRDDISSSASSATFQVSDNALVSINPATVTMAPGASQIFTATVSGKGDHTVVWSVSPSIGQISLSGTYTAPAVMSNDQIVVVSASLVADPTKTAVAYVTLAAPITVTVTPGSVSLGPSGRQAFVSTVTGAASNRVLWSLSPAVGTISDNGIYVAPAIIANSQQVNVIASSQVDPSKSATSTVFLTTSTLTMAVIEASGAVQSSEGFSNTAVTGQGVAPTLSQSSAPSIQFRGGITP